MGYGCRRTNPDPVLVRGSVAPTQALPRACSETSELRPHIRLSPNRFNNVQFECLRTSLLMDSNWSTRNSVDQVATSGSLSHDPIHAGRSLKRLVRFWHSDALFSQARSIMAS